MSNLYQNSFNNNRSKHNNLNQINFGPKRIPKKNNFNDNNRNHRRFNTFNTNRLNQNNFRSKPHINNRTNNNNNHLLLRKRNQNHIQQHRQNILKQQARLRKNNTTYSVEEQTRALQSISKDNDTKTEELMREYEVIHKVPLILYMFDIINSIRISNKIENKNINVLLPLLPCAGGIFNNLWRLKQSKNNLQHFLAQNNIILKNEIKNILNYSQRTYTKHFKQIPLPQEIKYKVNGIWETDVKLIRSFNTYLYNLIASGNKECYDDNNPLFNKSSQCEYHLRIWCNGIIEKQLNTQINTNNDRDNDDSDDDSDSSDDSDPDDPYANYKPIQNNINTFYPCMNDNNIDIAQVIQQNKSELNILKFQRKLKQKEKDDNKDNDEEYHGKVEGDGDDYIVLENNYEGIDKFVQRVCKKAAMPKLGDAIMILIDARNDPEIMVYIWRKHIKLYDEVKENINIGNVRIHYKKQKYFNLKYNNNIINVGQYIGLNTCILDGYIHQYWSIFNRDIRFEKKHVGELWPNYYENQTLFEVKTNFDEKYAENDEEKKQIYKEIYGDELIDKLNDEKSEFNWEQIYKIEEQAHQKLTRNDNNKNDDIIPEITLYGPMKYHTKKAIIIRDLKNEIEDKRNFRDFTPKQYRVLKDHAKAHKFSDVSDDEILNLKDKKSNDDKEHSSKL
eukprot:397830_1